MNYSFFFNNYFFRLSIGAPGSLVYTYLGEFHAQKQRAKAICYVGFFWTLSWLILPGKFFFIFLIKLSSFFIY